MNSFSFKESEFFHFPAVFGFDEAGRGPLAGPVTIAIVSFSEKTLTQIHKGELLKGIADSKKISAKKRMELFPEIQKVSEKWIIQSVSPKFIEKWNINQAIFYALGKAISKLQAEDCFFILDGNYKLNQSLIWKNIPNYISIPKADNSVISVAAASILAKVARDRIMEVYSKKISGYEFEKNMGYGTQKHCDVIRKKGLSKIHRISYCKNILDS